MDFNHTMHRPRLADDALIGELSERLRAAANRTSGLPGALAGAAYGLTATLAFHSARSGAPTVRTLLVGAAVGAVYGAWPSVRLRDAQPR